MATLALLLGVGYVVVVFVVEPLRLRQQTGASGWVASLGATAAEKAASVLFLLGCGLELSNPALVLAGVVLPRVALPVAVGAAGVVLSVASVVLAMAGQHHMGRAWRTSIDPKHPAPLVTTGPFRVVRNPTYTSLLANSVALSLLVPTPAALVAVLVCLSALQLQTRWVEEPHLSRVHGASYERYTRQVGRFVPSIGRLSGP
ncbi:MAG: isoprenylcysteine carboxylmethyltransferase family protein [Pseudonocardiaceae bacterium]